MKKRAWAHIEWSCGCAEEWSSPVVIRYRLSCAGGRSCVNRNPWLDQLSLPLTAEFCHENLQERGDDPDRELPF
jgi:hypothetical protein